MRSPKVTLRTGLQSGRQVPRAALRSVAIPSPLLPGGPRPRVGQSLTGLRVQERLSRPRTRKRGSFCSTSAGWAGASLPEERGDVAFWVTLRGAGTTMRNSFTHGCGCQPYLLCPSHRDLAGPHQPVYRAGRMGQMREAEVTPQSIHPPGIPCALEPRSSAIGCEGLGSAGPSVGRP